MDRLRPNCKYEEGRRSVGLLLLRGLVEHGRINAELRCAERKSQVVQENSEGVGIGWRVRGSDLESDSGKRRCSSGGGRCAIGEGGVGCEEPR